MQMIAYIVILLYQIMRQFTMIFPVIPAQFHDSGACSGDGVRAPGKAPVKVYKSLGKILFKIPLQFLLKL